MRDAITWPVPGRDRALLALLVGLAALAATFPLLQRPAEAQTPIWSATLTVHQVWVGSGDDREDYFGCDTADRFHNSCNVATVLSDNDFSYGGTDYEVLAVYWIKTKKELMWRIKGVEGPDVQKALKKLTLNVTPLDSEGEKLDDTALAFSSAKKPAPSHGVVFSYDPSPAWTNGQTVQLSLTPPSPKKTNPVKSPGDTGDGTQDGGGSDGGTPRVVITDTDRRGETGAVGDNAGRANTQPAARVFFDPTLRSWPLTKIEDEGATGWWFPIGRGTCDMKDEDRPWTWKRWKPPTADRCGWISIPDIRADLEEPVDRLAFKVWTALLSAPDISGRAAIGRPAGRSVKLAVWALYPHPDRDSNSVRRLKGPYETPITVCLPGRSDQAIYGYDPSQWKWIKLEPTLAEHPAHICALHPHDLGLLVVGRGPSP